MLKDNFQEKDKIMTCIQHNNEHILTYLFYSYNERTGRCYNQRKSKKSTNVYEVKEC